MNMDNMNMSSTTMKMGDMTTKMMMGDMTTKAGMGGMHGMHGKEGMDMNSSSCGMPGMMMYFHTGTCEYVLFEKIIVSNVGEMVGACIVMFAMAILYEGLKATREYLIQKQNIGTKYYNTTIPTSSSKETMVMEAKQTVTGMSVINGKMLSCSHFTQTVLHMIQVFVSYCLMLVFMTYNVWLGLSIILGAGAGYFIFGWKRAVVVDINEHCH